MGSTKRPMLLIGVGLFVIALLGSALLIQMSMIPTGWNTDTNFDRVVVGGQRFDLGTTSTTDDNLYIGHVYTKEAIIKPYESEWESTTWVEGMEYAGTAMTKFTLSGPSEVWLNPSTLDWEPVFGTDIEPFDYYTKTINAIDYTYEHRVFEVDIQVITQGTSIAHGAAYHGTCDGLPSSGINWPHPDGTEYVAADADHAADFEVRVAFNLNPWAIKIGDTLDAPDTSELTDYYVIEDQFMGVMSASVIDMIAGKAAGAPDSPTYGGFVLPTQQKGAQLSLFNFDDSTAQSYYDLLQTQDSSALGSIQNVPLGLLFALSASIEPGLQVTYGTLPGTWAAATPVQNFVTWRVRIDVLTALGVRLVSGSQPTITPTPTITQPPPDFPDPIGDFFAAINAGLADMGTWFSNPMNVLFAAGMLIIVLVIVAYILGKSIPFLMPARKIGVSVG